MIDLWDMTLFVFLVIPVAWGAYLLGCHAGAQDALSIEHDRRHNRVGPCGHRMTYGWWCYTCEAYTVPEDEHTPTSHEAETRDHSQ